MTEEPDSQIGGAGVAASGGGASDGRDTPGDRGASTLSLLEALLPILTMMGLFATGAAFLDFNAELLIVVLLGSAAVAGVIAVRHGHTWDEIQRSAGDKIGSVLPAILILLAIGALVATWVLSGTIPFLVYWGVNLVQPRFLVLTAFLATALMSIFTGTSWGSAGTIGVALMGTASALGSPLAATAGAVVSGAYFGDKLSPLSDSTNISAIGAGAPLFDHIRHMLYTSIPSFVVAASVYGLAAQGSAGSEIPPDAVALLGDIQGVFSLNLLVLIPPLIVVGSIALRMPPALAIAASCFVAMGLGVALQGFTVQDALGAVVTGFDQTMLARPGAGASSVGQAFLILVERGGLYSMAPTLVVIISAFLLAAGMDVSGGLDLLIQRMLASVESVFGLILATMSAGATMIGLTSHGGVTALVIGGLFQPAYRERCLAPENLSRSIEDSVTLTEPLMPWTVSAVFMATTLGVPTVNYAPWAVFCYGGPIFSVLIAAAFRRSGVGIRVLPSAGTP